MAWTDYQTGLGEITPSPLESRRFGYAIARVTVGFDWKQSATTIDALSSELWSNVAEAEAQIVVMRFPSELARLPARGTVTPGWTVIPAGSIVYWSLDTTAIAAERSLDESSVIARKGPLAPDDELSVPRFLEALEDSKAVAKRS